MQHVTYHELSGINIKVELSLISLKEYKHIRGEIFLFLSRIALVLVLNLIKMELFVKISL